MTDDPKRELEDLHQDLQDAVDEGNDDAADMLEHVGAYLETEEPSDEQHQGLRRHLGDAVLSLEVSHPRLSAAMQRALDSLTAAGI